VFRRPARGLFDFLVAALCVWAAYYHTPAGALLRRSAAWATGIPSSARPLLAYYGGGAPEAALKWQGRTAAALVPRGELTPSLALGYGAFASLQDLPPARRAGARDAAARYHLSPALLDDASAGPAATAQLVDHLKADLGSDEAAVLGLFCGYEAARYARDRALAEGGRVAMEKLARQLPPDFEERVAVAAQALTFGTAYGLAWPVPEGSPISSPFGVREHPILGGLRMHTGVDLPVPQGTSVRATAPGVVRRASEDSVNGKVLVIDHGNGVTTAYCHNSSLAVRVGQPVERGELIAWSGNTGRSTGPHLHYQLELSGHPVDPLSFRGPRVPRTAAAAPRGEPPLRPAPVSPPRSLR